MNYQEMSREELCMELKDKIRTKRSDLDFNKTHMDKLANLLEVNKSTLETIEGLPQTNDNLKLLETAALLNSVISRFHQDHVNKYNELSNQIAELTQLYLDLKPRCSRVMLGYYKSIRSLRNFYSRFS